MRLWTRLKQQDVAHERPELRRRSANFVTLTPVSYLSRAADFFGDRVAVVHGEQRYTYREFRDRVRRLAHALAKAGIKRGDTVAILAANCPALLEAHYAVPMLGAVLNPINIRLDAPLIAFCLEHGEARLFLADREFHATVAPRRWSVSAAVGRSWSTSPTRRRPALPPSAASSTRPSSPPAIRSRRIQDPRTSGTASVLLYTSGTTGNPEGAGTPPPRRLSGRDGQRAHLQARS